ncbi:hypothetical protein L596_018218 [Steinernema carpocapsae]|uniref:Tyrosine-protein kinase n=1 Tax=Steinernema carpocapsae TaxID=34508 RepID=A0A4U5N4G6_STECR|nr:hypothetical protein L596_018218 [Steinernema carpocapsae]
MNLASELLLKLEVEFKIRALLAEILLNSRLQKECASSAAPLLLHSSDCRLVERMKQRKPSPKQSLPENLRIASETPETGTDSNAPTRTTTDGSGESESGPRYNRPKSFREKALDVESPTQDDPPIAHPDEFVEVGMNAAEQRNEYMRYAPEDVAPPEEAKEKQTQPKPKEKRTQKVIQRNVLKTKSPAVQKRSPPEFDRPEKRLPSAEPPPPPPMPPAPASSASGDEYEMLINLMVEPPPVPPVLAPPKTVAKIEEQHYYHGLLPREDVVALLHACGDFLVRTTEMVSGSNRQFCISVNWSGQQHHFIVQTSKKGLFFLEENAGPKHLEFPEVIDLVNHYLKNHREFSPYKVVLMNPICRQSWQLRHDQVQLSKRLGEGAFGEVYSGVLTLMDPKKSKVDVAIKLMKCESFSKHQIEVMMKEARIMRGLSHPNVVRFYGVAAIQEPLLIVMELVTGGALHSYLRNNATKIPVNERMNMCLDAALGIDYVHRKGLVHRDIAARNCLYGNKSLKISDFGLSKKGKKVMLTTNERAPVRSIAPEVFLTQTYTPAADVWAYGVLVWEIFMHGMEPYVGWTGLQIRDQIINHNYRLEFPWWTPAAFITLLKISVFTADPKNRITCAKIARELEKMTGRSPPIKSKLHSTAKSSASQDTEDAKTDPKKSGISQSSENSVDKTKSKNSEEGKLAKKTKKKCEEKLKNGQPQKAKKLRTEKSGEEAPKTKIAVSANKTAGSREVFSNFAVSRKKGQSANSVDTGTLSAEPKPRDKKNNLKKHKSAVQN